MEAISSCAALESSQHAHVMSASDTQEAHVVRFPSHHSLKLLTHRWAWDGMWQYKEADSLMMFAGAAERQRICCGVCALQVAAVSMGALPHPHREYLLPAFKQSLVTMHVQSCCGTVHFLKMPAQCERPLPALHPIS